MTTFTEAQLKALKSLAKEQAQIFTNTSSINGYWSIKLGYLNLLL